MVLCDSQFVTKLFMFLISMYFDLRLIRGIVHVSPAVNLLASPLDIDSCMRPDKMALHLHAVTSGSPSVQVTVLLYSNLCKGLLSLSGSTVVYDS